MTKDMYKTNIVWIFSYYLPTQPLLELPMYNEILNRNIEARYVVMSNDLRLKDAHINPKFPTSLVVIDKPKQLNSMMGKNDLLICRFGYKDVIGNIAILIKSSGKRILMYDVGGVDIFFREVPATYLTAKTEWYKQKALQKIGNKYEDIFVVGSPQYDEIFQIKNHKTNKKEFINYYKLNPNKKLALLTPANPGEAYMDGIKDDYKKITEIVNRCSGYELMIKGHPSDYSLIKSQHYNGKHSWDTFAPKIKVVAPDKGYEALNICDIILNIRSSLAIEIPILHKPLININSHKYIVNWPKVNDQGIMKNIEMKDLEKVLNTDDYYVDKGACDKYVLKYCDPVGDGKAYMRIADVVEKLI